MHKLTFLLLFAFSAVTGIAQSQTANEIVTQGFAKVKVKADVASFTFAVEKRDTVEKNAIVELNKEADKVITLLNKLGFENKQIKIYDYEVSSNFDSYTYTSLDEKPKIYTARNTLTLSFAMNTKLINAIYQLIQENEITDVNLTFNAELSDSLVKATNTRLMQMAIADGKQRAENIATGLGVKLGRVKQVNNENRNYTVNYNYKPARGGLVYEANFSVSTNSSFSKLDPDEKELDETVTLTFELLK